MNASKSQPVVFLLVALASVFVIAWGIKTSAPILNPILLATVITVVVLPMPQRLTRRGLPAWLSFVVTLLLVVGVIAAIVFLIFFSFANVAGDIAVQLAALQQQLLPGLANGELVTGVFGFVSGAVAALGNGLVQMSLVLLIFVFMLSGALLTPKLDRLGPETSSAFTQVTQLTQDVRRYMSITTAVNFLVAVGNVILLWIVGVNAALLWGLLAFVTGYIPTVGFWIALIPPTLIAYSTIGVDAAVVVFLGYVLINGSVQNFIQPRMMGQGLGVSPVVVFISLFVWSWLLGPVGAVLSMPLTMIIMAVLYYFEGTRWIAVLMSAPRSERSDVRSDAQSKLSDWWQKTRRTVTGPVSNSDVQEEVDPAHSRGQ